MYIFITKPFLSPITIQTVGEKYLEDVLLRNPSPSILMLSGTNEVGAEEVEGPLAPPPIIAKMYTKPYKNHISLVFCIFSPSLEKF